MGRILAVLLVGLLGVLAVIPHGAAATVKGSVRVSGSGSALPFVQELAKAFARANPDVEFRFEPGTNSGGAIRGVVQGTLDLAAVNRPLSEAEAKEDLQYIPFARDAVVFAVHLPNTVQRLTTGQVREIYAGRITDWKLVGGTAGAIIVLDRDPDESQRKLAFLPLMGGTQVTARTVVLSKASEMIDALASTPGAIGYTSLGLLRLAQLRTVRALILDGVLPSPQSLMTGGYPWSVTFGLAYRSNAKETTRFVEFVRSAEGRRVIERYDLAPLAR